MTPTTDQVESDHSWEFIAILNNCKHRVDQETNAFLMKRFFFHPQ